MFISLAVKPRLQITISILKKVTSLLGSVSRGWNGYMKSSWAAWHIFSGRLTINVRIFWFFLLGGRHLVSTYQWVSKLHCLSALQRSYRAPSAQASLPTSASKLGYLLQQQPRGSMCARDRGKAGKIRCSPVNHLLKCYSSSNALLSLYPLPGGALPSMTWCAGPCCLPATWGPLLRQENLRENEN